MLLSCRLFSFRFEIQIPEDPENIPKDPDSQIYVPLIQTTGEPIRFQPDPKFLPYIIPALF